MAFTQTVDQAIAASYLLATGKAVAPTSGTAKYTKLLALLNMYTQVWAGETGTDWKSLYSLFTVSGTVTATDTFAIPATVGKVSRSEGDFVRINHTDGTTQSTYTIVPIERLYNDGSTISTPGGSTQNSTGTCAISGSNIIFPTAFKTTDAQYGGTIKIPGYSIPATLTTGTDVITVDDPFWLCFRVAAEYIRNDVTRVQLYGSLIDQANDAMTGMKEDNESQSETVYSGGYRPLGNTW